MKTKTVISKTSCKSEDGKTVDLIDSLITILILRVIRKRKLNSSAIKEALIDFRCDKDLDYLLEAEKHYNIVSGFKVKYLVPKNTKKVIAVRSHYKKYLKPKD